MSIIKRYCGYIGIYISKPALDIFIYSSGKYIQVANRSTGIKELFKQLKSESGEVFLAFEPTGGYERLFMNELVPIEISYQIIILQLSVGLK